MNDNPFKFGTGTWPQVFIGREHSLELFEEGLEEGPGSPGLVTLISGSRGIGKTVLLEKASRIAKKKGWSVVSETAIGRDLLIDLEREVRKELPKKVLGKGQRRLSAITAPQVMGSGGGGANWETLDSTPARSLRDLLFLLAEYQQKKGRGVLVEIDEVQAASQIDLQRLSAIVQHLIREELPIALIVAGLPGGIEELLRDRSATTFLRRAERVQLDTLPIDKVELAFRRAFASSYISISDAQLARLAQESSGYPSMVQLLGFHVWRHVGSDKRVTDSVLQEGLVAAQRRLGQNIIAPELKGVSTVSRTFLLMMARDDGPSRIGDIMSRMGVDNHYISQPRQRLINAGIIKAVGHGKIDFVLPNLRSYLRENEAYQIDML